MITVQDICSGCEHLWSEHRVDAPKRFDSVVPSLNGQPCSCCVRMARTVERLNTFQIKLPSIKPSAERVNMVKVGEVKTKYNTHNVSVQLDETCIGLRLKNDDVNMTPEQTIEVAQLLMKAAECQTEYAAAAKELEEQKAKLDAKYKDMISGLGLENPDLQEKDLIKNEVQRRITQMDAKLR